MTKFKWLADEVCIDYAERNQDNLRQQGFIQFKNH